MKSQKHTPLLFSDRTVNAAGCCNMVTILLFSKKKKKQRVNIASMHSFPISPLQTAIFKLVSANKLSASTMITCATWRALSGCNNWTTKLDTWKWHTGYTPMYLIDYFRNYNWKPSLGIKLDYHTVLLFLRLYIMTRNAKCHFVNSLVAIKWMDASGLFSTIFTKLLWLPVCFCVH